MQNLRGKKFGGLTVEHTHVGRVTPSGVKKYIATTKCDCGARYEVAASRLTKLKEQKCPLCREGVLPPIAGHPLAATWHGMNDRCANPKTLGYQYYGARGISVCALWARDPEDKVKSRKAFWAFVGHVGERPNGHSLDRRDNDGNYEPGNVRWADDYTQQSNKRRRPKKDRPAKTPHTPESRAVAAKKASQTRAQNHRKKVLGLEKVEIML